MELTGKCKEDFEKWYELNYETIGLRSFYLAGFYEQPETMQYGVYVDFFDSVKMNIIIERRTQNLYLFVIYFSNYYGSGDIPNKQTRPEARTAAIEKANELYNLKQIKLKYYDNN
jgi:hypothetical protein